MRHSHSSHVLHSHRVLVSRYAYSLKPNPWEWLTSKEKAEAMAEKGTITLCVSAAEDMSP